MNQKINLSQLFKEFKPFKNMDFKASDLKSKPDVI